MQGGMVNPMTDESKDDRMRRLLTGTEPRPLPRRFYKTVSVDTARQILLDGKPVRTPMKQILSLPSAEMAQSVAAEWDAQTKVIEPARMPLTRLANTAIDRADSERASVIKELVQYADADLICYRVAKPEALVVIQREKWDPVLAWMQDKLGVRFEWSTGIVHKPQTGEALAAFEGYLNQLNNWYLTAHYNISTLTGSVLLTTMLIEGGITADMAWVAAHVDEDFQVSEWGEDEDAKLRRAARRAEFDASVRFATLIRSV
jgi:chaperone required for assembly of F1-ATPase